MEHQTTHGPSQWVCPFCGVLHDDPYTTIDGFTVCWDCYNESDS